jgi:hypothetical protein
MPEELVNLLKPITDLFPSGMQEFLNGGGWWIVIGVIGLILLLIVLAIITALWRLVFRRKKAVPPEPLDKLVEDLSKYRPPAGPPGLRRLLVEGVPARLCLVVLAPVGKDSRVDPDAAEMLLEHVIHGLGAVFKHDRPPVRIWPAQLSNEGFAVIFQRLIKKPEPEGKKSHWTMVAGRNPPGKVPILVGLCLYTDEPTTLGRLNVKSDRWGDVLRVKGREA